MPTAFRRLSAWLPLLATVAFNGCRSTSTALPTELQRLEDHAGTNGGFSWPEGMVPGQALDAEQCVTVALWNSPDYAAALADLGIARGEMIKAGEIANPSLSLLFPSDLKAFELAAKLPLEALWLRPKRQQIARTELDAVAARLTQAGTDLARDVRLAVGRVWQARRQAGFAAENLRLSTELLRIAETRMKAGESGELELSQARADASLAAQEQNRLNHEERLMLERLRSLMGMAAEPSILEIRDPNREMPGAPNLKAAINEAVHARADVRAAELAVIAAGKRTGLAKAEVFSLTSAIKFTDGAGTQPGFDLPIPIFNQNQAARVLADARLQKALRQLAAARHRAAAETREALARLRQAKAVFQGWQSVLPELETALEKARKAVTEGAALPFLALDAARRLAEARSKAADSDFQQQAAAAELRRALGKI